MQYFSQTDFEHYDARPFKNGDELRFMCSLSDLCRSKSIGDKHRSLAVNTKTGLYFCHRCGTKGCVKENWTKTEFKPRRARTHAALARVFSPEPKPTLTSEQKEESAAIVREIFDEAKPIQNTFGQVYLESRKIPLELAEKSGVRFSARFYGRAAVLFPMFDRNNELIAINGRFTDGQEVNGKLKTQTAGKKSLGLFVTPDALESDTIAVCEGVFDALSLHLCGLPAVAVVGTSAPEWLPNALAFRRVLIASDADDAGDKFAEKLTMLLRSRGARVARLRSGNGKDWNENLINVGREAMRARIERQIDAAFNYRLPIDRTFRPLPAPEKCEVCTCPLEIERSELLDVRFCPMGCESVHAEFTSDEAAIFDACERMFDLMSFDEMQTLQDSIRERAAILASEFDFEGEGGLILPPRPDDEDDAQAYYFILDTRPAQVEAEREILPRYLFEYLPKLKPLR